VVKPGGQNLPLPVGTYKFVDDASAVPGQPGIREPNYRWIITWFGIPEAAVPIALLNQLAPAGSYTNALLAADQALGCVNSTTFPAGAAQALPVGTVLLESIDPGEPIVDVLGNRTFNVTYFLAVFSPKGLQDANGNAVGHQHIIKKSNPWKYTEITASGASNFAGKTDGLNLYNWFDLNKLFRVP
jgi:hypothetical protein